MSSSITILENPSMPDEVVDYLRGLLANTGCYLEYGAGGSSRLAARMNVRQIFSVDSDKDFLEAVETAVKSDNPEANYHPLYCDIGPTGAWGRPLDTSHFAKWPAYSVNVWNDIRKQQAEPDVVLIDGRFRPACFLASLLYLKDGATIIFDDYTGRTNRYKIVEKYAAVTQIIDRAAIFQIGGPRNLAEIGAELARQCVNPL